MCGLRSQGMKWGRCLAEQSQHAAKVGERGSRYVDTRVRVLDPLHGNLLDAHAGTLRDDKQLGVEEPSLVAHDRHELVRDLRAHRLEPALGVAKARVQQRTEDKVVRA